jgi:nicotinamidase-related amidase/alkylated DNA repair dioxygenase AlkB
MVVGLQNDFTSPEGKLPVNNVRGYIERIRALVPAFREHGEIFWITTEYRARRSVNDPSGSGCMVVAGDDLALPMVSSDDDEYNSRPSMRSNRRINQIVQRTMNMTAETDADSVSSSDVDKDLFLSQDKSEDNCCLPGSWGAELSPDIKDLVSPKDVKVVKSYYSAFTSSSLLQMLRAKLITEVYVVGCTTNLSVYATALDAAQHGLSINLVEDCLNYRLKDRHDRAVQKLVDIMGASVTTSDSVLRRLRGETPTDESGTETGTGQSDVDMDDHTGSVCDVLESSLRSLTLNNDGHDLARDPKHASSEHTKSPNSQLPHPANPRLKSYAGYAGTTLILDIDDRTSKHSIVLGQDASYDSYSNTDHVNLHNEVEHSHQHSNAVLNISHDTNVSKMTTKQPTRVSRKIQVRQMNSTLLGPQDVIGSGDSRVIYNLLEPELAKVAFQELFLEVHWQRMYHAAGEVPRLCCCEGDVDETDGSTPVYRHPTDQSLPLLHWSPTVARVKKKAEEIVGHKLNHALIQLYRSGQDHISEHSDKTLDIVPGSNVVNVSFGAQRVMRLRSKRPTNTGSGLQEGSVDAKKDVQADRARITQRFPMPTNSIFVMGPQTNASWLHGIMPDKRPAKELSPAESSYGNMRISITFRHIGTFLSSDSRLIWGQGAVARNKEEARETINGEPEESQKIINAFGLENQSTSVDWNRIYGSGLDVLHIKSGLPECEKPMLFLSGDDPIDTVVMTRLSRLGVEVDVVAPPSETLSSDLTDASSEPLAVISKQRTICFRQATGSHVQIDGEAAILEFVSSLQGSGRR